MDKKKKRVMKLTVLILIALLMIIACDMRLKTVTYQVSSDKITAPLTIILLTDLHGETFGKNQSKLMSAIAETNPDIVLLGGDIFDDNRSYANAELLLRELSAEYPCFYVPGNHEYWSNDITSILSIVASCQIPILSGSNMIVECNGQKINICGLNDPDALVYVSDSVPILTQLQTLDATTSRQQFSILLSHRPELAETYRNYSFDLVLSGHAHGGQWRIPGLINGLYAPNQGLFPKYAGGRYDSDSQTLIVSRGLSRVTTAVPRIFNRPELVVIELIPEHTD